MTFNPKVIFLLIAFAPATQAIQEVNVDAELQLLLDVSGSVSSREYQLQLDGYVNAFEDTEVQDAIFSGSTGSIAVQMIMWSGATQQQVMIDWMVLGSVDQIQDFSSLVATLARPFYGMTAIGDAIDFAVTEFVDNGFNSDRQVIDISGDGVNNDGGDVRVASQAAFNMGIDTINGIVITQEQAVIDQYTSDVVGGDKSFIMVTDNFVDFEGAISQKLVAEISGENPLSVVAISEPPVWSMLLFGALFIWAITDKKK